MSEPFIGEIRMFAGNFAPVGWALCDGQLLPISGNEALFSLLGTTYGGDGQATFGLPDLRGRIPVHMGTGPGLSNRILGERSGAETITLTSGQLPAHSHHFIGTDELANTPNATRAVVAKSTTADVYINEAPSVSLAAAAVSSSGGGQSHDNLMPSLCVSFIIAMFGVYPPRN